MVDLNALLGYPTGKVVKILDWRLGLLKYIFTLGIVFYVVGWVLLWKQGYLIEEQIVGTVRFQNEIDPIHPVNAQCITPNCIYNLPNGSQSAFFWNMDHSNLFVPEDLTKSIFITTYIQEHYTYRLCNNPRCNLYTYLEYALSGMESFPPFNHTDIPNLQGCPEDACAGPWTDANSFTDEICDTFLSSNSPAAQNTTLAECLVFISQFLPTLQEYEIRGGLEDVQILIEHNAVAKQFYADSNMKGKEECNKEVNGHHVTTRFSGSGRYMAGSIVIDQEKVDIEKECGEPDTFTLSDMTQQFKFADQNFVFDDVVEGTESYRQRGVMIQLDITYSNTYGFFAPKQLRYEMELNVIPDAFHIVESLDQEDVFSPLQYRRTWVRHGMRMDVVQSGKLGKFQFQKMIIQLVTSLGMLAVATTVVDMLATKLLPQKEVYKDKKYQICEMNSEAYQDDVAIDLEE